jgi:undecaprenyl-diphosphatase
LPENRAYLGKLIVAFLLTAVLGLVAKKLGFNLPENLQPVAWALIVGGFWIFIAEWIAAKQPDRTEVTWLVAILVGIAVDLHFKLRLWEFLPDFDTSTEIF